MKEKGKVFFIQSIPMVIIEESTNIPTVLFYESGSECLIGNSALRKAQSDKLVHLINQDFKVDLGNIDITQASAPRRKYPTANNSEKSATELTDDFLKAILSKTTRWLNQNGLDTSTTNILVAEPVKLITNAIASKDWLSNYRKNIRRIIENKGFQGRVDFLPEPLAVFQYYRYGIRHPAVAERKKYQVFVIDFGGGTFDVSIIETTKDGDIKKSGDNSKPIAADSTDVGGFYINQVIIEELLIEQVRQKTIILSKPDLNTGIDFYKKWRKGEQRFSSIPERYQSFINNFQSSIYRVEEVKIAICRSITDWSLDTSITLPVQVALPTNILSADSKFMGVSFSANQLREIFIRRVWNERLKNVISQALKRGEQELNGAPINIVLLSGGSANILWLEYLLKRDFSEQLGNTQILRLKDFQEAVSKGLAAECVRRFYTPGGDFSSVTYNRLCLVVDPDKSSEHEGYQITRFKPESKGLPEVDSSPSVLLPSASVLKSFIEDEKPMKWRFRLSKPPHRQLDYFFLRSSFDPQDINNLQNLDHTVYTPKNTLFDSNLHLELKVKADGTALPKFIYKTGRTDKEMVIVEGKPFYLDSTYYQNNQGVKAYIGLDFGTSNTSISFVDQTSVEMSEQKASDSSWKELSELVNTLPYPLAEPLARYVGESNPSRLSDLARQFIEASLTVAAYVAYSEHCAKKGRGNTSLFKNFKHRSASPLWTLLKDSLSQLGNKAEFSLPLQSLLKPQNQKLIDAAVAFRNDMAHDNATTIDHLKPVTLLANINNAVFSHYLFGFFEQVKKHGFKNVYRGVFRQACGPSQLLFQRYMYKGGESFSESEPFLVDQEKKEALRLMPIIFWYNCQNQNHSDLPFGHCYLFDKDKPDGFHFKSVGYSCPCIVSEETGFEELGEYLKEIRITDAIRGLVKVDELTEIAEE